MRPAMPTRRTSLSLVPSFPAWQLAYEAVLTETDIKRLFKLVEIAEAAVLTRRSALEGTSNHHTERMALEEAVGTLRFVKKEQLHF
jgi:hypothetical protein